MTKILANDGIHPDGQKMLEDAGFEVVSNRVPQEDLPDELTKYRAIIVRSATKVRKELIDQCPDLKVIARAGVGLDNIDVDYARDKGIKVINTPAASSRSVAELVFGHMINLARRLHRSNREMPAEGRTHFKKLKKSYATGFELQGKTLGIIGLGRIGEEVARVGLGLGMNVLGTDPFVDEAVIKWEFSDGTQSVRIPSIPKEELLKKSDFISIHVPFSGGKAILGASEMEQMKKGAIVINTSRGGVVDEQALLERLDSGLLGGAGLDVFLNEPQPSSELLEHREISLSPHIGASTVDAQRNIGLEIAEQLVDILAS